jgi:hypothetical protein
VISIDLIVAILSILGGIVWLVRLEGRVNTAEAVASVVAANAAKTNLDIVSRLERIEKKQDDQMLVLAHRGPVSA